MLADLLRSRDLVDWSDPVNRSHPLNLGLRSWYLAVPGGSTGYGSVTWRDLCGRHNGTLTGMTPATEWGTSLGRRGGWGRCSPVGNSHYVNTGISTPIYGLSKLTLTMWFRRRASSAFCSLSSRITSANQGVSIIAYSDGSVYFISCNGASQFGGVAHNDTLWHRAVLVFDGTQSTNATRLKGYIDGIPKTLGFTGTIQTTTVTSADTLQIGEDVNVTSPNGDFDDVRVLPRVAWSDAYVRWDYELSQAFYPDLLNRIPLPFAMQAAGAAANSPFYFRNYVTARGIL